MCDQTDTPGQAPARARGAAVVDELQELLAERRRSTTTIVATPPTGTRHRRWSR